jgi:hypothetical protein
VRQRVHERVSIVASELLLCRGINRVCEIRETGGQSRRERSPCEPYKPRGDGGDLIGGHVARSASASAPTKVIFEIAAAPLIRIRFRTTVSHYGDSITALRHCGDSAFDITVTTLDHRLARPHP